MCSMYAGHEAALYIEMCAASKHVANLRVSLRLSPEGGGGRGGAWPPFAPPPPPPGSTLLTVLRILALATYAVSTSSLSDLCSQEMYTTHRSLCTFYVHAFCFHVIAIHPLDANGTKSLVILCGCVYLDVMCRSQFYYLQSLLCILLCLNFIP